MSTTFPTSLDNLTSPSSSSQENVISHAGQHANANDSINALETKVGADSSAVTTTLDYKLKNTASIDPGHHHTNTSVDSLASTKITGVTFPAGTIVGTTDSQALTNKTITSPVLSGTATGTYTLGGTPTITKPTLTGSIQVVTAMAAQALNGSLGNVFTRTLAASETFTQSNFSTGQCFMVRVKQGSGTTYTVTWFATVTWITSGATAPVQTTTTNGYTTYGFICTGAATFDGYLVGTN